MAILTVNTVDRSGTYDPVASAVAASAGGDSFPNSGTQYAFFKNGGAGSITVSLVIQATVDGQTPTARTVTIPAGVNRMFGPFPTTTYNDTNGRMNFTYSGVTSLTVAIQQNTTS